MPMVSWEHCSHHWRLVQVWCVLRALCPSLLYLGGRVLPDMVHGRSHDPSGNLSTRCVLTMIPLRVVRYASSARDPHPCRPIVQQLETMFQVPVIEYYGMTEAASQITSNPLPPRMRKPGSVGVAAGPEVAVMDESGMWSRRGQPVRSSSMVLMSSWLRR